MKKVFIVLLLMLVSLPAYATKVQDAIDVSNILAGKSLTSGQIVSIVDKYNASWGSQWANPWDETDNPTEFAAWPTNEEKATFYLDKIREETRSRLYRTGLKTGEATADAAIKASAQAAADEL